MTLFENMNLDPLILKSLERMQYKQPSAIQVQTIPLILQGKDLIALSKTGSGKTAACAIPICNKVNPDSPHVQALIIVPTRELAMQYATETQKIGYEKKVKAFAIFGGEDATMQQTKLKSGVQVLVATPGRLIDFIYSRQIDLTQVDILVLDEADEMLGMGFYDDLAFIINCLVHEHQTLLFSATMQEEIRSMAKKHMKAPQEISLLSDEVSPESIEHRFLYCRYDQRDQALLSLLEELKPKQTIIFCHSRIQCEKVCRTLQRKMADVDLLHAGLGQDVRSIITNKFRHGKIRYLVATDIAARGLDFSNITHVFIYQLSDSPDVYVHRSGRTGRQERAGVVVTLVTEKELKALSRVLHHIRRKPIWIGNPPPERNHPRKRAVAHKNNKS
ncbi:DEAD/DEAH box helicase [Neochlamydia sp. EPS4]|uniref:DEAD/DEAH box helicase n=1 Tax=Neochlamydia sp. EPS4 TaxID=1478175 RepID=UPI0005D1001D|nr:DEAD/DEAH box helicase [Neochlamydia sp. EPS4]